MTNCGTARFLSKQWWSLGSRDSNAMTLRIVGLKVLLSKRRVIMTNE